MIPINRKFHAYLDHLNIITVLLPKAYFDGNSSYFELSKENDREVLVLKEKIELTDDIKYVCQCENEPNIGQVYWVTDEHGGKTDLQIGAVVRTKEFDDRFYYDGPLGMKYKKERTAFRIWAPTATHVQLKLYTPEHVEMKPLNMVREDNGTWSVEVEGDLDHYRYSFAVCVNFEWRESVDPYAVSVTANGKLGVIIDLEKTITKNPILPPLLSPVDAIIYETHIRDFTIHQNSGVKNKGTYLGVAELQTKGKNNGLTGLSYVKSLGITHIQFLPFHDFEGVDELGDKQDYNWGYNPLHFNVPEGSYSSNPEDPYARIIELKNMIAAIHEQGIRIIMDVVYNHVHIREESSFEKIVPGYYFRYYEDGSPANGTGVGNDFATERQMARKFVLDSIIYWTKEYHIDGFRFDLMGIFDIETMSMIREKLDQIDKNILTIGEGWDLNTPIPMEEKAAIRNQKKLPRIGQFNDWFRDAIKGSTFNLHDRGYALGNGHYYEAAKQVIGGSIGIDRTQAGLFMEPDQSVNYVECHDNHTFWDKMSVCSSDEPIEVRKLRQRLATTIVLLSQGIPFLNSGQEFFRTKQGVGNSYRSPDQINELNWDHLEENKEHVEYIKGIIDIRKSHKAFRLPKADLVRKHVKMLNIPNPAIGYWMENVGEYGEWEEILVLFNSSRERMRLELPKKDWKILADNCCAKVTPISHYAEQEFNVEPCTSYVLVK
jgi:pullulanase